MVFGVGEKVKMKGKCVEGWGKKIFWKQLQGGGFKNVIFLKTKKWHARNTGDGRGNKWENAMFCRNVFSIKGIFWPK